MRYVDQTICCKSTPQWYEPEIMGIKPNTVRPVPIDEMLALGQCNRISIENSETHEVFERDITSMFDMTDTMQECGALTVPGCRVIIICWDGHTHESYERAFKAGQEDERSRALNKPGAGDMGW